MKLEKTLISSDGLSPSLETQNPKHATEQDEDHVLAMARDFVLCSPYKDVDLDEVALRVVIRQVTQSGCLLVTDNGFIAGVLTPLFFAPHIKVATELAWWAPAGDGTALRLAFEAWAKSNGAHATQLSTLNNTYAPQLAAHLNDNGYVPVEVSYLKAI